MFLIFVSVEAVSALRMTHSPIFVSRVFKKVISQNDGKNLTFKSPLMGQHFSCPVHVDIKLLLLKQYSLEIFL